MLRELNEEMSAQYIMGRKNPFEKAVFYQESLSKRL